MLDLGAFVQCVDEKKVIVFALGWRRCYWHLASIRDLRCLKATKVKKIETLLGLEFCPPLQDITVVKTHVTYVWKICVPELCVG